MAWKMSLAAAALALAGCSQNAAEGTSAAAAATPVRMSAVHPVSGLKVIPLTVAGGGKRHRFRVEVAQDPATQARGLMFRTEMGADEGMLFPLVPARTASFWMRNTVLSLDIIFISPDRKILNIAADTVPYSEDHVLSDGIAGAVLELNAGRASQLGLAPGDVVSW